MNIMRFLGVWTLWMTAAACSTTPYYWQHSVLAGPAAQQQLAVDQDGCFTASGPIGVPPQMASSRPLQQAQAEGPQQYGLTNAFSECMAQRGWSLRSVTP